MKRKVTILLFILIIMLSAMVGCNNPSQGGEIPEQTTSNRIEKDREYSNPEEVAEYIHIYKELPKNYLTKKEAASLGWESQKGNLWDVTDQMSIGGDTFGNREGLLPKADGRQWYECDVNYVGGFRGQERLVYSNDGLIYYTKDHYKTFTEMILEER